MKQQAREELHARKPHLVQMLKNMQDFYLEIKWDFHSWSRLSLGAAAHKMIAVPFLSTMLPSDVCRIYKRGASLRCVPGFPPKYNSCSQL